MADGDEGLEERTEEATQHRRDEFRKDGNVSQSRELASSFMLLSLTGVIYASSSWFYKGIAMLFTDTLSEMNKMVMHDWNEKTVVLFVSYGFRILLYILGPVFVASLLMGTVSSLMQTGFIWSAKSLEPDLGKLSPLRGLKRIFSLDGAFEMGKAIMKFILVGGVAYIFLSKWVRESGGLWEVEANGLIFYLLKHVVDIFLIIGVSMFGLSLVDYGFQRFRYEQKLKMTRQEVRDERKTTDGNPQIKARIRSVQRQVANRRMMAAVRTADVIITNPTHIAVAIVYDRENMFAPKVVAKGADFMAERIKKIAREAGIPCVENVPLARAMYKALKIGQFISRDLYNAVAEVLAYVYRLKGKNL